ncbi:hypothetical protein PGT21_003980 [Puccinia graminis f. sp. tritici]|uniref:Uncharacterized protein n=1 Tax=Puccinia graminis f. sp. tritici TaxID=56615 RepID=A0A5B0LSS9_PUCGR|nr:hypothetical protein PGT21_003980 [Puccinia graminis f. sp. tritici]KAA1137815.1 hypothetical protein PGTUg99_022467 [Puccinia graminis f. sp. tritici]
MHNWLIFCIPILFIKGSISPDAFKNSQLHVLSTLPETDETKLDRLVGDQIQENQSHRLSSNDQVSQESYEGQLAPGLHQKANLILDHLINKDHWIESRTEDCISGLFGPLVNIFKTFTTSLEKDKEMKENRKLLEKAAELIRKIFQRRAYEFLKYQRDPSDQNESRRVTQFPEKQIIPHELNNPLELEELPFSPGTIAKIDQIVVAIDKALVTDSNVNYRSAVPASNLVQLEGAFWEQFLPAFLNFFSKEFQGMDKETKSSELASEIEEIEKEFLNLNIGTRKADTRNSGNRLSHKSSRVCWY